MASFRNYTSQPLFTDDYRQVREFLIRINKVRLATPNFTWGRWEWMTTHGELDRANLSRIGLWEEEGELVALVCYESRPGEAFFCLDPAHARLQPEMLRYAHGALSQDGKLRALLPETDRAFQRIAAAQGFRPTQERECIAALDIDGGTAYTLPDGFCIHSMADGWDWHQYHRCMWRGFNHDGPPPQTDREIAVRKEMLSSPTIRPELVLCVVSPEGEYVSHCGMWYHPGDDYALVEPVATDPQYRKLGLGKAAVLEAARRCGKLGAKQALVGSSQQFYYNIGFAPIHTENWWEIEERRRER